MKYKPPTLSRHKEIITTNIQATHSNEINVKACTVLHEARNIEMLKELLYWANGRDDRLKSVLTNSVESTFNAYTQFCEQKEPVFENTTTLKCNAQDEPIEADLNVVYFDFLGSRCVIQHGESVVWAPSATICQRVFIRNILTIVENDDQISV
jgi:hypothetical protein